VKKLAGQTIAEKILSNHSVSGDEVKPGDIIKAKIDLIMILILAAGAILKFGSLRPAKMRKVFDPEKIIINLCHYNPATNERIAMGHKLFREFVNKYGIKYFYDIKAGISQQVLPEKGHIRPGMLIVAGDSHTPTWGAFNTASCGIGNTDLLYSMVKGELWFKVPKSIKIIISGKLPEYVMSKDIVLKIAGEFSSGVAIYNSIEYSGKTTEDLTIASRMTMSNFGAELGAKFAIFEPDQKLVSWVKSRTSKPFELVKADSDANYKKIIEMDISDLEPQIACPHSVDNVKPISEVKGIKIDQAYLGSCSNGRYEDFEIAAKILDGNKVHPDTRLIVSPASQEIWLQLAKSDIVDTFINAGAIICNSSCGACFGGHQGILAAGERCITTTPRNFRGRMGSIDSEVYLGSPATVTAAAIAGQIVDPREY
jgi:homoaconitate hydratase family protein